ncbi:GntR family transcriptional regulator [Nocardiopsis mangrovi]|uniref:GntR family transcriptional regulator n=1 Tax=Nocardiopsis mangrovi TaxID=1179818 RepID=A0ABV9DU62_9ACTN
MPASDVLAELREQVMYGGITPGSRINIDAVARDLGVSATPVRDALNRLEADRLVVYTQGRGYTSAPLLDLAGLRALYEYRLLIEPWAARRVATDILVNPAGDLRRELAQAGELLSGERTAKLDIVMHDVRFHETLIRATGNPFVVDAYTQTHCHVHTYRLYGDRVSPRATLAEHTAVVDAVAAQDGDGAAEAMTAHITNSFRRFASTLSER